MNFRKSTAILMSLIFTLSACSPREAFKDVIDDTSLVKEIIRDNSIVASQIDKRRSRHLRAAESTTPQNIKTSHLKKRTQSANGQQGWMSTAQVNGTVVGMFDGWIKPQPRLSYDRIQYVVFKFMNDKTMQSGAITNSDGESSYTTEVWRYHNNTWCAVVPQIKLNIRAAAAHTVNYSPDSGMTVRLMTGSNDGVLGEVSFVDQDPYDNSCDQRNITPLNRSTNAFYNPLVNPVDKTYYQSKGQFVGLRIVDTIGYDNTKQTYGYTGKKYLTAWTSTSCRTAMSTDTDSGCANDQMLSGDIWFGPISSDVSQDSYLYKVLDGSTYTPRTARGASALPLLNIEPFTESYGDYEYYNLAISIGADSALPMVISGSFPKEASKFSVSEVKPITFDVKSWMDYSSPWNDSFPMVTKAFTTSIGQTGFEELMLQFANSPVSSLKGVDYQLNPGLMKCWATNSGSDSTTCSFFESDNNINPSHNFQASFPSAGDRKYLKAKDISSINYPGTSLKINSRSVEHFTGNAAIAKIQPTSEIRNVTGQPNGKDLFSLRAIMYKELSSNDYYLGLQYNQIGGPAIESGINFIRQVPFYLAGLDQFSSYKDDPNAKNTQIISMDLQNFNIIYTPISDPRKKGLFYIYANGADSPDVTLNNNTRRTKGGVFLCVAGLSMNFDTGELRPGIINWSSCSGPRDGSPQNGIYGSQFASATDVFGEGNNMMAPLGTTHSVSPDGKVFLNYFAASGAIFTLNVTESVGNSFKNWERIRTGRTTMCTQQLIQPPPPKQESKWKKFGLSMLVTGFSIVAGVALPGAGELIGLSVELLYESMEAGMDDGDDSKTESYQFADGAKLQTSCGI